MATEFKKDMDFDEWRSAWFDLAREKGHQLKEWDDESGMVDQFVTRGGICNGPGCVKCGWSACMHCDWKGERIPTCDGGRDA